MSGRLYCLASTESNSCMSSVTSASAISVFTWLSDKSVKLVCRPRCPCCPSRGSRGSFGSWSGTAAWRGSLSAPALVVDHDELALVRPAVPLQEDPRALQPQLRAAVGAALLLDTCSLLQPAQFFVKKRSSEKSEVLVTLSVLEAKSCGAETPSSSRRRTHAARRHSAARGREGAVQALAVQRARRPPR